MKRTIWKFILPDAKTTSIDLPKGATVLSTIKQFGEYVLYALVNPNEIVQETKKITPPQPVLDKKIEGHLHHIELESMDRQVIKLPDQATFVDSHGNGDKVTLTFCSPYEEQTRISSVAMYETGQELPSDINEYSYLTSVTSYKGYYVVHVFTK